MPIQRCPVKDEPQHRIDGEDAIDPGMGGPFAEALSHWRTPRVSFGMGSSECLGRALRIWTDDVVGRQELGAKTKQEAHDNESGNNARESEAKNVAHMVSGHASSGLVRG